MSQPPSRERKVITVLFADLVGFTARSETLDPEDVEAILHPYHERLRAELERHGGTVEKFIGDAVMAVFGAPLVHEHDPVDAKGKAEPVRVWEAMQARSRLEVDVQRPRAPLVARDRELDVLVDALARVRSDRATQLVTLVGEPGIGKSRLVYELFQAVELDPELIWWRHGRS